MQSFLLLTLILLSIGGYYLGRNRAFAVAGGQIRHLHSLPSFYGSYTALWCGLPALIVFAVWATLQPGVIIDLVVAGMPPELRNLPPDQQPTFEAWAAEKIKRVVPLNRWQKPQDIADMVVFLASARANNITGQTMNVDGGFVMHW